MSLRSTPPIRYTNDGAMIVHVRPSRAPRDPAVQAALDALAATAREIRAEHAARLTATGATS